MDAARLIARHELSSLELTDSYLARIERLDPILNSFLTVMDSSARTAAGLADAEIGQGTYRGTLHGIPVGLKDVIDTAGTRTTAGSRRFVGRVPTDDAAVVSRLRAAGAVILGKLTLYEFALGPPREGDLFPPARNPWNLAHGAGGSSSGSSAAVAARLCAAALGTDAGGSIRRPAAESGVVGLKPTQGLVSNRGLMTHSWSLDHIGPLARSVEDTAAVLTEIAADPVPSGRAYQTSLREDVGGSRAGVPWKFIRSMPGLKPEVLHAVTRAVDVLKSLGLRIVDVDIPTVADESMTMLNTILYSEARAYHAAEIDTGLPGYGLAMRERLLNGAFFTAVDYVQAQRARSRLTREFTELLREVDVLVMPTIPHTSPSLVDESRPDGTLVHVPFARLFNLTGQPSISVPCGYDAKGLPIGLMLSASHHDERTLLRVAYAYESATASLRRPYPEL